MTHSFQRALIMACFSVAAWHAPAQAAILSEQAFSDGLGSFSVSGSASTGSYGVRLRGGSGPGVLSSPVIDTQGWQQLKLTVDRSSSGLDSGELASIVATVNGQARTLEALRSASGAVSFNLGNDVRTVALRFQVQANSALETFTIAKLRLEGERSGTGCPGAAGCEPTPTPTASTTIVPDTTWTCGMPGGIPDPGQNNPVFTTLLTAGTAQVLGTTPYGTRRVTPTLGGTLSGGSLSGSVLSGSLDFDLNLPSGAVEHEARYTLRASDNTLIYLRTCGVADGPDVRFVADFEAPSTSSWQWLNAGTYVGRRQVTPNGIRLSVYPVSASPNPSHAVSRVPGDPTLRQQSYQCAAPPANATKGAQLMVARVNIGSSQSVGASKNGRRNIIPITGGSYSGSLGSGTVNAGGADYQLTTSAGLQIEARYTLKAANGETIVVRNCGDFSTGDLTAVTLEAKADGAHAGMNQGQYLGTIQVGLGRVTITVFERK